MPIFLISSEFFRKILTDSFVSFYDSFIDQRRKDYIGNETFMVTYGDGVSDININELVKYHQKHKKIATITAIQPGGKFGALSINKTNSITSFIEKSKEDGGWINGGYMVLEPKVFDYIKDDETAFEKEPLESLAKEGELMAYKYDGFWQCMDTLKDKNYLEDLLKNNNAPWVRW